MKKILLFFLSFILINCSDGEFVIEELDFDEDSVQLCDNFIPLNEYVFYNISEDNSKALSIQITSNNADLLTEEGISEFNISNENVLYRIFDGNAQDFFCNEVQPASPKVIEEWVATSGTVEINTSLIDNDNDGIAPENEGYNEADPESSQDTDGDGLPDYRDLDDDGDNIPTSREGYDANGNSRDSDNDGIPDYLDDDDDNDGVLTKLEVIEGNLNPLNNTTDGFENPNYLEPDVNLEFEGTVEPISHTYNIVYTNVINIINDFQLVGNGQEIKYQASAFEFGVYVSNSAPITHEF